MKASTRNQILWYLAVRHQYRFDGKADAETITDRNGKDGIQAFYHLDTHGKMIPTRHPNILRTLIRTKGSVNLHIKMYAQDLAKGLVNIDELQPIPDWMIKAITNQSISYEK